METALKENLTEDFKYIIVCNTDVVELNVQSVLLDAMSLIVIYFE